MSGYYNQSDPDGFTDGQENSGGGLRSQLEEALKEIKDLRKQLTGDKREKTVTDLLKDKGLDPAVAELIPEGTDPTEWVEKYSHLLGAKGTETEVTDVDAPEIEVPPDDDPALVAEREALAAMQGAAQSGSQATVQSDLFEKMDKMGSEEELLAFFKANGMA